MVLQETFTPENIEASEFNLALNGVPLADALQHLTPVDPHYAILPITDGFNWADCFSEVSAGEWYLVVFRSKHRHGIDKTMLVEHDERAQESALHSPGFLYYFMGSPLPDGSCMSFCLWNSQQEAQLAARHPVHREAQSLASTMYEMFALERHIVRKTDITSAVTFTRL